MQKEVSNSSEATGALRMYTNSVGLRTPKMREVQDAMNAAASQKGCNSPEEVKARAGTMLVTMGIDPRIVQEVMNGTRRPD